MDLNFAQDARERDTFRNLILHLLATSTNVRGVDASASNMLRRVSSILIVRIVAIPNMIKLITEII